MNRRLLHRGLLAAALVAAGWAAMPAVEGTIARRNAWSDCQDTYVPEAQFAGCTAVIETTSPGDRKRDMAIYWRGVALSALKRYDEAIRDLDQALAAMPGEFFILQARGFAWAHKQEWQKALRDLDAAAQFDLPHKHAIYWKRAEVHERLARLDLAIADYGQLIAMMPANVLARQSRCEAMIRAWLLDSAVEDCGDSPDGLTSRGFAHLKADRIEDAIADFNAALLETGVWRNDRPHLMSSSAALPLYGRGMALVRHGDIDAGKADIADAIDAIDAKFFANELKRRYGITP